LLQREHDRWHHDVVTAHDDGHNTNDDGNTTMTGHYNGNGRLLLEACIAAFNSERDAGHELPDCLRAVLNVAAPWEVSGPGVGIVSFVEPDPGEKGPDISLKDADNEAWNLGTVALTPDIFVVGHPSGNGFVAVHARGFHQWLRHSDCDCSLEVVDITADVGPFVKSAILGTTRSGRP
jgi:hypothetical protein